MSPRTLRKPPRPAARYEPVRVARDLVHEIDLQLRRALQLRLITSADAYALTDQIAARFRRAVESEELMERAERERRANPYALEPPALGGMAKRQRNEL